MKNILNAVSLTLLLVCSSFSFAGDFDWVSEFNVKAKLDPSGFKVGIATEFKIDNLTIDLVLKNTHSHGDAYVVFALGQISNRPIRDVLTIYKSSRDKGWGRMAQNLGIKPGSKAFKALKNGSFGRAGSYFSFSIKLGGGKGNKGNVKKNK